MKHLEPELRRLVCLCGELRGSHDTIVDKTLGRRVVECENCGNLYRATQEQWNDLTRVVPRGRNKNMTDCTYIDFSMALLVLKCGNKIARADWNGKGMHLILIRNNPHGVKLDENLARNLHITGEGLVTFSPYIMLHTAQGHYVPWVASQTDLLADDWITAR